MYSANITRQQKGAIILLLDQSGSMDEPITFGGKTTTKAMAVASVANSLIEEIINNCHRGGSVGDYFDLAVVGYGGDKATTLWGSGLRRIADINAMPTTSMAEIITLTMHNGQRIDRMVKRRCWVTPTAKGQTPMADALRIAKRLAGSWCRRNPNSFPPIVVNITDGEATDATNSQLLDMAQKLTQTCTLDGATLLVNIHLASEHDIQAPTLLFPSVDTPLLNNRHTNLLWQMSSTLPSIFDREISELKNHISQPPYKALCYNCAANQLVGILNIGSVSIERMI